MEKKVLNLTVSKEWFYMISDGRKTEEEIREYQRRLEDCQTKKIKPWAA